MSTAILRPEPPDGSPGCVDPGPVRPTASRSVPALMRMVDELPVAAALLDEQGEAIHGNLELRRLLDLSARELRELGPWLSTDPRRETQWSDESRLAADVDGRPRSWDLRLRGRAFVEPGGRRVDLVVVEDARQEARREALDQLFFHDVLNTLSSINGYLQVWGELPPETSAGFVPDLQRLAQRAIDEVTAHRDLLQAETGHLRVVPVPVDVPELLQEVCAAFQRTEDDPYRIQLSVPTLDLPVVTDPVLLRRVVVNLVKNALEASAPEQAVTVRWSPVQRRISVHNEGAIPEDVQARIFERSFSTKGGGRGIGTHSVRLLAETYLGGRVDFESLAESGTTFRVTLPERPPARMTRGGGGPSASA
jgi:signal transduction histidine kinase